MKTYKCDNCLANSNCPCGWSLHNAACLKFQETHMSRSESVATLGDMIAQIILEIQNPS